MYKYFIVWEYRNLFSEGKSNGVITLNEPITSVEHINAIQDMIKKERKYADIIITNIVRLED